MLAQIRACCGCLANNIDIRCRLYWASGLDGNVRRTAVKDILQHSAGQTARRESYQHLPTQTQAWPRSADLRQPEDGQNRAQDDAAASTVQQYIAAKDWVSCDQLIYFFCDIHADTDAFFLSLLASGGIHKTGDGDNEFELTSEGHSARFIIGGDCFDKGPATLRLLNVIRQLIDKGADLILLAGNHDIRTYLGIYYAESKDPLFDHLFVRMGKKTVPFLAEIFRGFIEGQIAEGATPDAVATEARIYACLFPSESWYDNFPTVANSWIRPSRLAKELSRIREKTDDFKVQMAAVGLDIHKVQAALVKFRGLFVEPGGEFSWFFERMQIAHREGSYLFVHAGVDDTVAKTLSEHGVEHLNQAFRALLKTDPFALYHGALGNVFRTKYRTIDFDFSDEGVDDLHRAGIYAIVHGHKNILQGQRMVIRKGMLNFECDASVDCHTRAKEGLVGPGGAVVKFCRNGTVQGISTDYPFIKQFSPDG